MIYDDIHELNDKQPNLFCSAGHEICFLSFTYLGDYAYFNLGLNTIPRKGESFRFPFIRPRNGGDAFYVQEVAHSIEKGKQEISIYLTQEYPNTYFQLLKEKAYLWRDISFSELIREGPYGFEDKLIKLHNSL
ncbi:MAG: hypothetical protein PSX81_03720 [bacterium]|nr:hypothetical protein [bacterium]